MGSATLFVQFPPVLAAIRTGVAATRGSRSPEENPLTGCAQGKGLLPLNPPTSTPSYFPRNFPKQAATLSLLVSCSILLASGLLEAQLSSHFYIWRLYSDSKSRWEKRHSTTYTVQQGFFVAAPGTRGISLPNVCARHPVTSG